MSSENDKLRMETSEREVDDIATIIITKTNLPRRRVALTITAFASVGLAEYLEGLKHGIAEAALAQGLAVEIK